MMVGGKGAGTIDPRLSEAMLLLRAGMVAQALPQIEQYCAEYPDDPQGWLLAAALHQRQNQPTALAGALARLLALQPDNQQALLGLAGLIGKVSLEPALLRQLIPGLLALIPRMPQLLDVVSQIAVLLDDADPLLRAYDAVSGEVRADPGFSVTIVACATRLQQAGLGDAGARLLARAVATMPSSWRLHAALGLLQRQANLLESAQYHLERALSLSDQPVPDIELALISLLLRQRDYPLVIERAEGMLADNPDRAELYEAIGYAALQLNELERSGQALSRALELAPESATAWCYQGHYLQRQGESGAALDAMRRAIELAPDLAIAWVGLAALQLRLDELDEAERAARQAVALDPQLAPAQQQLGACLRDSFCQDEAVTHFRRALDLDDEDFSNWRGYLFTANYADTPGPDELAAAHRAFGRKLAENVGTPAVMSCRDPDKRLRIGFVSADFRRHSVGYFILPLCRALAAQADGPEVTLVMTAEEDDADDMTQALRQCADRWVNVSDLEHEALVLSLRGLDCDIMVDLSGHTAGERLAALACRVAPLQVSYLGYANTTGLETMDGRITDGMADPPGMTERHFVEKLLRMPRSFLCYEPDPKGDLQAIPAPLPSRKLASGAPVRFGCFNNLNKVTRAQLDLWAQILQALPDSQLVLKARTINDPAVRGRLIEAMAQRGVDAERQLDLRSQRASHHDHLSLYRDVDISLDTFPYTGTTTTCESLLMGVPVLTLCGRHHAARVSASILSALELSEWITESGEEYVSRALSVAAAVGDLREGRADLRRRLLSSSLCDKTQFAQDFHAVLQGFWRENCRDMS